MVRLFTNFLQMIFRSCNPSVPRTSPCVPTEKRSPLALFFQVGRLTESVDDCATQLNRMEESFSWPMRRALLKPERYERLRA